VVLLTDTEEETVMLGSPNYTSSDSVSTYCTNQTLCMKCIANIKILLHFSTFI